ncbi:Protein phosphatase 2C 2 [Modicella reniformis]|uniref:protein-serine/threonine phosphatase n=1 Tax=Modicella reniformis TaxID=1440133 RepID=A0A9P6IY93_9FUNG|nr:Protein phosphatase 2C 2 [Modicella reniformis]
MEDAHTTLLDVEDANGTAFFAVYDGHGGSNIARYCGEHLHTKIVVDPAFANGDYTTAIKNGFLETDEALLHDPKCGGNTSGCTAITATIPDKNILYVGNAGDSRAVLSSHGMAIALSIDHKPANLEESTRIISAGASVESGRINCGLSVSRAFGDFNLKQNPMLDPEEQIVVVNPDVVEHRLTDADEFLVLACDGIWDCMSSQRVVSFVRQGIADGTSLDTICEKAMDHCQASDNKTTFIGCDNMTMIIVAFLDGRTVEEWYEHVGNRVNTYVQSADLPNSTSRTSNRDMNRETAVKLNTATTSNQMLREQVPKPGLSTLLRDLLSPCCSFGRKAE